MTPATCVRCAQKKCHSCRVGPDGRRLHVAFFMPFCMGGAINGRSGCYCVKQSRVPDESVVEAEKREIERQTAIWQYHFNGGRADMEIVR